jgi:hypothetical protein
MATSVIASALGIVGEPDNLDAQIEAALKNATHAGLLTLKTTAQEFDSKMRALDIKEAGLHLDRIADARAAHKERCEPFVIFCLLTVVATVGFGYIVEFAPGIRDTAKH